MSRLSAIVFAVAALAVFAVAAVTLSGPRSKAPESSRKMEEATEAAAAREPKGEVLIARAPSRAEGFVRVSAEVDNFPKPTAGEAADVILAVTESGLATDVARGENTGRRLAHVGVVRSLKPLGGLPEEPGTSFKAETEVAVEKTWRRQNLRAVVFAQGRRTRRVLAAGSVKLFE